VFRVRDTHGDSGLTGLASLSVAGTRAQVVDFVLSCRVMGRKVEETMVHWLVRQAAAAGATDVSVEYEASPRNHPCLLFWQHSGFVPRGPQGFAWEGPRPYPLPGCVQLTF
jgi:FkbH-like protein